MTGIERAKFFDSEISPLIEPIAEKCKEAGFAFIVVIKSFSGFGTVMSEWNTENVISDSQRQSIFSRIADSPIAQTPVQNTAEQNHIRQEQD